MRAALVDKLLRDGHIGSPRVAEAFRAVPRHLFVPGVAPERAYADESIPTKRDAAGHAISSSSQPAMMAIMLEQLGLEPGMRVLEVGAGTGYNAALLAHLVGPSGRVTTVDLDEDTVADARAHLAAAGFPQVRVVCGDGAAGYAPDAPYDRVALTVGAWDVLPAWHEQLAPGGRLLLPLSLRVSQAAVALERRDGWLECVSLRGCGFMPLRGPSAGPPGFLRLGDDLDLATEDAGRLDRDAVAALLGGAGQDASVDLRISPEEIADGLQLWVAFHDPAYALLFVKERWRELGILFAPWGGGVANTFGLVTIDGAALVVRPDGGPAADEPRTSRTPFAPTVRSFGDPSVADRLVEHVRAWHAVGRPGNDRLRITVYPRPAPAAPESGEAVIEKRHSVLVADWSG